MMQEPMAKEVMLYIFWTALKYCTSATLTDYTSA